jgi:hypothetical protein
VSPKRGIRLDQVNKFPDLTGLQGLRILNTGGTEFFGTTRYATTWGFANLSSTPGNTDGFLMSWPIPVPEPVTVDALRIYVRTAADTGDDVALGIYVGDGIGGRPSTKLADTGDIAVDAVGTATGTFTAVLLSPGLYWFAILGTNIDGATNPQFAGEPANFGAQSYFPNHAIDDNNFDDHAWGADLGAAATLPDPFTTSGAVWAGGNNAPGLIFIQARVA